MAGARPTRDLRRKSKMCPIARPFLAQARAIARRVPSSCASRSLGANLAYASAFQGQACYVIRLDARGVFAGRSRMLANIHGFRNRTNTRMRQAEPQIVEM